MTVQSEVKSDGSAGDLDENDFVDPIEETVMSIAAEATLRHRNVASAVMTVTATAFLLSYS